MFTVKKRFYNGGLGSNTEGPEPPDACFQKESFFFFFLDGNKLSFLQDAKTESQLIRSCKLSQRLFFRGHKQFKSCSYITTKSDQKKAKTKTD